MSMNRTLAISIAGAALAIGSGMVVKVALVNESTLMHRGYNENRSNRVAMRSD